MRRKRLKKKNIATGTSITQRRIKSRYNAQRMTAWMKLTSTENKTKLRALIMIWRVGSISIIMMTNITIIIIN